MHEFTLLDKQKLFLNWLSWLSDVATAASIALYVSNTDAVGEAAAATQATGCGLSWWTISHAALGVHSSSASAHNH